MVKIIGMFLKIALHQKFGQRGKYFYVEQKKEKSLKKKEREINFIDFL